MGLHQHGYSPQALDRIVSADAYVGSGNKAVLALKKLARISICESRMNALTGKIGTEMGDHRDQLTALHARGELEPEVKEAPGLAVVAVDGGRVRTRAEEAGRGVHDPAWNETKVACLMTMSSSVHEVDPHPELPTCFADKDYVDQMVRELKSLRTAVDSPEAVPSNNAASPAVASASVPSPATAPAEPPPRAVPSNNAASPAVASASVPSPATAPAEPPPRAVPSNNNASPAVASASDPSPATAPAEPPPRAVPSGGGSSTSSPDGPRSQGKPTRRSKKKSAKKCAAKTTSSKKRCAEARMRARAHLGKRLVRTCVASVCSSDAFGPMVSAEAQRRRFYEAPRRAYLADGLAWNWTLQRRYFPDFVPILDFVHPLSYLYEASRVIAANEAAWDVYLRWATACWQGRTAEVLEELRAWQSEHTGPDERLPESDPRSIVGTTVTYLTNNQSRMNYPSYRRAGLPVTSAMVESLIKEMNYRIKGSEKFWKRPSGAEAILQVRGAVLCDDADRLSNWILNRPGCAFCRPSTAQRQKQASDAAMAT